MIAFKKHQRVSTGGVSTVIAMCDADLLGKKLKGRSGSLDLAAFRSFYEGERISIQQAEGLLAGFFAGEEVLLSFNLVGKKTLKIAGKFTDVSRARKIGTVPHLQVYRV